MISFRDWMAQKVREYYSSDFRKDFFTAPELDRAFGYALAHYIAELLEDYESPALLELGAGSGVLAYDMLTYLKKEKPHVYQKVSYYIYDFSPKLVELQKSRLRAFEGKVFWTEKLVPIKGVIFSNEFFDCFPVHVIKEGKELFLEEGKELWKELSEQDVKEVMKRLGYERLSQVVEVCVDCVRFLREVAENLTEGYHLVIDYGYTSEELAKFPEGTVVGYSSHRFYPKPSEGMDITAHVNFSLLEEYGKEYGLVRLKLVSLRDFLLNNSFFMKELQELSLSERPEDIERLSRLKTLLLSMGDRFRVLVQKKSYRVLSSTS